MGEIKTNVIAARIKNQLKSLIWWYKIRSHGWLMGRVACMGQDVFALLDPPWHLFNIQKGRVDYLLDVIAKPHLRAKPSKVAPFLRRQDVLSLIAQEANLSWLSFPPPLAIYMDSYSELTDQLFIHRDDNWHYCCNYSDIYHTPEFDDHFKIEGFLPLENLQMKYRNFFKLMRQRWQNIPIVFLHFPVKLDKREKYQLRHKYILESITQLSQEFPFFYSVSVEETLVDWPELSLPNLKDFPYHYNRQTYQMLAHQIQISGLCEQLKTSGTSREASNL